MTRQMLFQIPILLLGIKYLKRILFQAKQAHKMGLDPLYQGGEVCVHHNN